MRDIFGEIFSTLRQNKLRTALTGFSVSWGIFMLIVLLGAGNGVLNALLSNNTLMSNSMSIFANYTSIPYEGFDVNRIMHFDSRDVDALSGEAFGKWVDDVSPDLWQGESLVDGDKFFSCNICGTYPVRQDIENIRILAGRFVNQLDMDEKRRSVVIGSVEVEELLGNGADPSIMLGRYVKIGPFGYKVVGVYKSDESMGGGGATVYAPFTTIAAIYNMGNNFQRIQFSFHGLDTEEQSDEFISAYRRGYNLRHHAHPDDTRTLFFWNRLESSRDMNKAIGIIRTALWILGLFTLLSGIVGVSNIMLITVKERTHEFGIRKAIGARPSSILSLIITESIAITAFFGYLGMFLGIVVNQIMDSTIAGNPVDAGIVKVTIFVNPTVGLDVAMQATLVLIVAGTIAGLVPAWKASRVKPIEALRSE